VTIRKAIYEDLNIDETTNLNLLMENYMTENWKISLKPLYNDLDKLKRVRFNLEEENAVDFAPKMTKTSWLGKASKSKLIGYSKPYFGFEAEMQMEDRIELLKDHYFEVCG
jgi:hypothetical protein